MNGSKTHLKMEYVPDKGKIAVILDFEDQNRRNIRHFLPPEQLVQLFVDAMAGAGYNVTVTPRSTDWVEQLAALSRDLSEAQNTLIWLEKRDIAAAQLEREKARLKKAKDFFATAQACYTRLDLASEDYTNRVRPLVDIFTQLMPDLACFAGCRTAEDCGTLSASLDNRRGHVCRWLKAHRERVCFEDLPAFPDLTVPEAPTSAGPEEVPRKNSVLLAQLNSALEEINRYSSGQNAPEDVLFSAWTQLLELCRTTLPPKDSRPIQSIQETRQLRSEADAMCREAAQLLEQAEPYCSDCQKMAAYLHQREKEWDYVRLLQRALPVLEEIARQADREVEDSWYLALGSQVRHLPEDPAGTFQTAGFFWIAPDSETCRQSESIQVDFRAGEASWPGLYCQSHSGGRLICIIPGSVAPDAAFGKETPECGN